MMHCLVDIVRGLGEVFFVGGDKARIRRKAPKCYQSSPQKANQGACTIFNPYTFHIQTKMNIDLRTYRLVEGTGGLLAWTTFN